MFFTQQEVELLNSWPKNAVGARSLHIKEAAWIFFSSVELGNAEQEF